MNLEAGMPDSAITRSVALEDSDLKDYQGLPFQVHNCAHSLSDLLNAIARLARSHKVERNSTLIVRHEFDMAYCLATTLLLDRLLQPSTVPLSNTELPSQARDRYNSV